MSHKKAKSPAEWEHLPEEELLKLRVRDLGLRIEGSWLEDPVKRLYEELSGAGITFHPPCYLADEWLAPDKVPVMGIPFYLAHPRLKHLEQKMMLEVEGGTEADCMKLLRHEAGHALNYAHELFKRTRWRELFGPFSTEYTQGYYAQPYSRRFVRHLQDNYAQNHPDDDWAETFAVWLDPRSNWQQRYKDWPAIRKLQYVQHVFEKVGSAPPKVTTRQMHWSADRMTSTLEAFYQRRRRYLAEDFPGFYDPGLQRIFSGSTEGEPGTPAAAFIRHHRRHIIHAIATCTRERKYDIDQLLRKLIRRCEALGLRLDREPVVVVT